MSVEWAIPVVCTDKGGHKKVTLTRVEKIVETDGTSWHHMPLIEARDGVPPWYPPVADADRGVSRSSYVFDCPKCNRHVVVSRDRWWTYARAVVESLLDQIDVSLLP